MLEDIIKRQIRMHGPMDVGSYMNVALTHPDHGYYMKKDPLGATGDFTTAPEISQMFGEVIAAWLADLWIRAGKPAHWGVLECGAGRGTLMADIMRVFTGIGVPCQPYILEISPTLRALQKEKVPDAIWIDKLSDLPQDMMVIAVGNEILDALPFRQLQFQNGHWHERMIAIDKSSDALSFSLSPTALKPDFSAKEGDIFELSPAREGFVRDLRSHVFAGILIDYGHLIAGAGDTFQAMYKHEFVDVLSHVGDADLTSHVDFSVFEDVRLTTQGAFLKALGIEARANVLRAKAPVDVEHALRRLVDADQMGELFKVMGFCRDKNLQLAGF